MKIGFAFCGSFCNHPELLKLYEDIAREHEIVPILSENAAKYSTRFGTAEDFVARVEALAGRKAVRDIVEAEPLGPQGAMEVLVIAPCGPRGSASTILRTAFRPASASTRVTKSSAVPKRVEYFAAFSDKIGTISCSRAMSS